VSASIPAKPGPLRIVAVVGNPRAGSRTLGVAQAVAGGIAAWADRRGLAATTRVADLAELGPALLDWEDPAVADLVADVLACDVLVVASPTYKAAFTGLLKLFLDRIGADALARVVTVPVMVAGAPIHQLALEGHLRPVLMELGAACPTPGLFVVESELDDLDGVVDRWLDRSTWGLTLALVAPPPGVAG